MFRRRTHAATRPRRARPRPIARARHGRVRRALGRRRRPRVPVPGPGYPTRLEGRDAIREYLRDYPNLLDIREVTAKTVHETADPAVVVAEFTVAGVVVATGKPYELSYIAVITVEDGEIRHYRDYWSPLAAAELLGGVEELTAAFSG